MPDRILTVENIEAFLDFSSQRTLRQRVGDYTVRAIILPFAGISGYASYQLGLGFSEYFFHVVVGVKEVKQSAWPMIFSLINAVVDGAIGFESTHLCIDYFLALLPRLRQTNKCRNAVISLLVVISAIIISSPNYEIAYVSTTNSFVSAVVTVMYVFQKIRGIFQFFTDYMGKYTRSQNYRQLTSLLSDQADTELYSPARINSYRVMYFIYSLCPIPFSLALGFATYDGLSRWSHHFQALQVFLVVLSISSAAFNYFLLQSTYKKVLGQLIFYPQQHNQHLRCAFISIQIFYIVIAACSVIGGGAVISQFLLRDNESVQALVWSYLLSILSVGILSFHDIAANLNGLAKLLKPKHKLLTTTDEAGRHTYMRRKLYHLFHFEPQRFDQLVVRAQQQTEAPQDAAPLLH